MICMAGAGKKKGLLNGLLDTMSRGGKNSAKMYDTAVGQETAFYGYGRNSNTISLSKRGGWHFRQGFRWHGE